MDVARRTVVKGMLAAGALLAAAKPGWRAERDDGDASCLLVLGGSECDGRFANAVHEAADIAGAPRLPVLPIAGTDCDASARLFAAQGGARLLGIMDDAAYAVFHESVRSAGARLAYLGRHTAGRAPFGSRHALVSTSALAGVGAAMARSFVESGCSVIVTESCLGVSDGGTAGWGSVLGFRSFEVRAPEARSLHVSGVSTDDVCALVGIDPACVRPRPGVTDSRVVDVVERGWVTAIARALITTLVAPRPAAAPGGAQQVFVHRASAPVPPECGDGCVTFVIDV